VASLWPPLLPEDDEELEERMVSGVTLGAPIPGVEVCPRRLVRSGVGREGDSSVREASPGCVMTKLFMSVKLGASKPGSPEVNALTAG
jgi:hypothetical protein